MNSKIVLVLVQIRLDYLIAFMMFAIFVVNNVIIHDYPTEKVS